MVYKALLKDVFGFDSFRPGQEEIIQAVIDGQNVLAIMPTGGGKSLCYQIPGLLFEGLTVVISPLISLMKDQVEQLLDVGVAAAFLNSSLSAKDFSNTMAQVKTGEIKLLYLAPEALLTERILELLSSVKMDCLTIDEAHCISEWGHDFRPEYRQLIKVRKKFPKAVCMALTATATPRVQQDIMESLNFEKSNEFVTSFNRDNLFLEVAPKVDPATQTLALLKKYPNQSGIIYCFSRRQVDELSAYLKTQKYSVLPYHAGLTDSERKKNQELFIKDDVQIIVATIAFGMGINKPNVRFVIHFDLPKNIESYYQEIGRSGRDGLRAHCLLLFGYGDQQKIRYFIDQKDNKQDRQNAILHLDSLVRFCESRECRRIPILNYFGENYNQTNCDMCDNCVKGEQKLDDVTELAQKFLSCVYRTGQKFGANHIIDVLRGSNAQKVTDFRHHLLPTFGIGKELSKKQWLYLSRQLISDRLLEKEPQYGGLLLTEKANDVLFKNKKVNAVLVEETPVSTSIQQTHLEYDVVLFDRLKTKRKELADKQNVPPYVVFSDKSLIEMATFYPHSRQTLLDIHGVGVNKINRYGTTFLQLIETYCKENNLVERLKENANKTTPAIPRLKKKRYEEIGEAYTKCESIAEMCANYGIKQNTVVAHLLKYVREGKKIPKGDMLALTKLKANEQQKILHLFEELGTGYLTPIFEQLKGKTSFEDLHVLRLFYENQK